MMRARLYSACALLAAAWLGTATAWSCSVPVFRYALDRWPGDQYTLELNAAALKAEPGSSFVRNLGGSVTLNLKLNITPGGDAPTGRLLFPRVENAPVWSGPLEAAALSALTSSPAREQIVKHILAGESAVWVLVESGDRHADEEAATLLEKRLRYLEQVAQLPVIDPTDPSSRLGPGPELRVKFSLLRVKPNDSRETAFLKMLAGPKGITANGPWFATVFGRGRVLGAWPAENFGKEQMDEVCLFVLGACSCQVKNLNPGWDILLAVDWDHELERIGAEVAAKPSATSTSNQKKAGPQPEIVTIRGGEPLKQTGSKDAAPLAAAGSGSSPVLPLLAGALLLAGFFAWRSAQSPS